MNDTMQVWFLEYLVPSKPSINVIYYYFIDNYAWSQLQSDLSETPIQFVHPLSTTVFSREAPFWWGRGQALFLLIRKETDSLRKLRSVLF